MNIKKWSKLLIPLGVLAVGAGLAGYLYWNSQRNKSADDGKTETSKANIYSQSNEVSELKPRKDAAEESRKPEKPIIAAPSPKRQAPPLPPEVNLFTSPSSMKDPLVSDTFAPYGRLIKCRTVMTVDSSRLQTPVIGEVMEEVWHTGLDGSKKMIIERGVEVHGTAQGNAMRDRISTGSDWVLVWRNADSPDVGKELVIKGIALENSQEPDGDGFTITDGSAGIPGYIIKGSELKEIIALISTFVSGLGAGLVDTNTYTDSSGNTTSTYDGNLKTAVALGVQRSAELYAQRMLRQIAEESTYVRAPAGTPFYLYVTQPLDLKKANIAGTSIAEQEKEKDSKRDGKQVQKAAQPQMNQRNVQSNNQNQERQ